MALSEAKKAADRRHTAKLDQIMIRPYKEEGAVIRAAAKASGKSVQAFILEAIRAKLAAEPEIAVPEAAPAEPASMEEVSAVVPAVEEPVPDNREESPDEGSIETRCPVERLGTEVLKLPPEESAREILRLERVRAGIDLMMIFCNMTREERDEWKRRRAKAVQTRQKEKNE